MKLFLLVSITTLLILSGIDPVADRLTWFMETVPVMIGIVVLTATHRRFELSMLSYQLLWLFGLVLIFGGHYTYAENPLFNWLRDTFDLARNYYDRVGHILQGFVPAIVAREVLLRCSPLRPGKWLFVIVTALCLAISAVYELVEWLAALTFEQAADAFLGTQGDHWDTQWDMFLALVSAMVAQLLLSARHDRELARLEKIQFAAGDAEKHD
jgi:putative membrane protein